MFDKVKKQMLIYNSALIGVLLFIFVVILFTGILWVVYNEEKNDLLAYAREEAEENLEIIENKHVSEPGFLKKEYQENSVFFFYLVNDEGKLIHYAKPHPTVSRIVREKIKHWDATAGKPLLIKFSQAQQTSIITMVALPVESASTVYGTIYVGKDISSYYQIIKKILISLIVYFILFIALITLAGYLIATKAMQPLKRSYQRQQEFLADASHELRTPLSILLTSVDALQHELKALPGSFVQRVVADMRDEIKTMAKIVDSLLTLARSDAAMLKLLKERFNLRPIAEQIIRILNPLAQEKAIDLQSYLSKDILIVADKERIRQLLLILLDNALKYTPSHGRIELLIQWVIRDVPELQIMVKDNGIGIPEPEQRLIFERFYRVDKARSRANGGIGLGLPIAKWIVESHGGSIQVMSQPGQGTTFLITLPQPLASVPYNAPNS